MSEKSKPLPRTAMKFAEAARQSFVVDLPAGTSEEKILEPDFWRTCGATMGRGDLIDAIDEAGCVLYRLMVREGRESSATGYVSLTLLQKVELVPIAVGIDDKLPPGCVAKWLGESQKWGALRNSQVMKAGFDTKQAALKYFGDLAQAGSL